MVLADALLYRNFLQTVVLCNATWQKTLISYIPGPQKQNEGTFTKIALLQNRPVVSSQLVLRKLVLSFPTGSNFIHPHPPTPEDTLLGVRGCIKGGAYKIPAAWGLKIYTPTPLPWKMPFGQKCSPCAPAEARR